MKRISTLLAAFLAVVMLAASCGGSDSSSDGDAAEEASGSEEGTSSQDNDEPTSGGDSNETLLLGASLPLTGGLGAFGPLIESGYRAAIDEVNAAGGLQVGDTTYTVELKVLDNKSDGNEAAAQARDLALGDEVVALLGAVTPPLSIPLSVAAEQNRVPIVNTLTPVQAWLGGNPDGWNYAFDFFFDELQQTDLQYQTADLIETNKKVALFTDLEEDGIVMGGFWESKAEAAGYEVVYRAEFAVGTTNFATQVSEAQAAGAEIVIAQVIPPDAIALLKQMKASGYVPALMFVEKGSAFGAWPAASEGLGDGIMVTGYFAAGLGLPDEAKMIDTFAPDGAAITADIGGQIMAYSGAKVLMDAIAAAGSTDADAIVAALEAISGEYPAGHIDFGDNHASPMPVIMTQWNNGETVYVTSATGEAGSAAVVTPLAGLDG